MTQNDLVNNTRGHIRSASDQSRILASFVRLLKNDMNRLKELIQELHPADIHEIFTLLPLADQGKLLLSLPHELAAKILSYFDETSPPINEILSAGDLAPIVANLASDDRAALLNRLPEAFVAEVLKRLNEEDRAEATQMLRFEQKTAGALMNTECLRIRESRTVQEAINYLKTITSLDEEASSVFVVDDNELLRGQVSFAQLIKAKQEKKISELIGKQKINTVGPDTPQEEVARIISRYDLMSIAVVDYQKRLMGAITVDDVIDVLVEEQTEESQRFGGITPLENPYFKTGFWVLIRKRASWLTLLFVAELFTGTVMRHYEKSIAGTIELVFFIPLIISSGGNSGSQSATLITRALAVGEVKMADFMRVIFRESRMGIVLGCILGVLGFLRAYFWNTAETAHPYSVPTVVAITLVMIVCGGSIIGAGLPLVFKKLGFDPAISSSPFVASLVDIFGIVIYLSIATFILV